MLNVHAMAATLPTSNADKDRQKLENKRCQCITSRTFPHRYKNCMLRKVIGDSIHKTVFIKSSGASASPSPQKASDKGKAEAEEDDDNDNNDEEEALSAKLGSYVSPIMRNDASLSQGYIYGFIKLREINCSTLVSEYEAHHESYADDLEDHCVYTTAKKSNFVLKLYWAKIR